MLSSSVASYVKLTNASSQTRVGELVGPEVGPPVGPPVGADVGPEVGPDDGLLLGTSEGL